MLTPQDDGPLNRASIPIADNDDIPFDRDFPLRPGIVDEVRPGVRRLLCDNRVRSPLPARSGTSWAEARSRSLIPDRPNEARAKALLDAVRGETVTHVLVTHTHDDHSPNTAADQRRDRCAGLCRGAASRPRPRFESEEHNPESGADHSFRPDIEVKNGDTIEGCPLGAGGGGDAGVPPTPCRVCLAGAENQFRRGPRHGFVDLDRGPADRSMIDYMDSLARLEARPEDLYFSGHGPEFRKVRATFVSSPAIARPAKPRFCIASPRGQPTFPRWCARFVSASTGG